MPIAKYKILNPLIDHKKPYYDTKRRKFIFPVKVGYKYFLEAAQYNPDKGYNEYFILLGTDKFDDNCRTCEVDMYGKCKLNIIGELKDYIIEQSEDRGNLQVEYVESGEDYDVFTIISEPEDFIKLKEALINNGVEDFITSEVTFIADNLIELDEDTKEKVEKLIDTLEDDDDVQNIYHNMA